jgi:hypothetical protein
MENVYDGKSLLDLVEMKEKAALESLDFCIGLDFGHKREAGPTFW